MYIRFTSHRARQYGLRALTRTPESYFSYRRQTGPGGVYLVTEDEIRDMRAYSDHARFTRLQGPHDDLLRCW